jgi:poly(3-hydroxybutyrate) depolymerase
MTSFLVVVLVASWLWLVSASLHPDSLASDLSAVDFTSVPHHIPDASSVQAGSLHYFNLTRPEGVREFYVYLFTGYTSGIAAPVAIYYHGFGGGYVQGLQLNMTEAADRHGYILVFPQGTPSTEGQAIGWNGGRCCVGCNDRHDNRLMTPLSQTQLTCARTVCLSMFAQQLFANGTTPVDDVMFTRLMLKMITSVFSVDAQRVYAMVDTQQHKP